MKRIVILVAALVLTGQAGCVYRVVEPWHFGLLHVSSHYVSNRLTDIIGFAGGSSEYLVIETQDKGTRLLDARTGRVLLTQRGRGELADGGRVLLFHGGGEVRVMDLSGPAPVERLSLKGLQYSNASISADGTHLAAGDALWNLRTASVVARLPARSFMLRDGCFSPDGTLFAAVDTDRVVHLWDAPADRKRWSRAFEPRRGLTPGVVMLGFSADGQKLVVRAIWAAQHPRGQVEARSSHLADGDISYETELVLHVLDARDGATLYKATGAAANGALTSDRKMLWFIDGKGGTTKLLDLATLTDITELPGRMIWPITDMPLALTDNGSTDGRGPHTVICLWDLSTRKKLGEMTLPAGWSLRHVGRTGVVVVLQKDRRIRVVEFRTGRALLEMEVAKGYPGPKRFVTHAAFDWYSRNLALDVDEQLLILHLAAGIDRWPN